jgi:hypothetical protein
MAIVGFLEATVCLPALIFWWTVSRFIKSLPQQRLFRR